MDPFAIGKLLADLGGWTAFVILSVAAGVGVVKGWIVPGRYFDREVARGDKAETQALRNAEAIERLTTSVDVIVEAALRERGSRRA